MGSCIVASVAISVSFSVWGSRLLQLLLWSRFIMKITCFVKFCSDSGWTIFTISLWVKEPNIREACHQLSHGKVLMRRWQPLHSFSPRGKMSSNLQSGLILSSTSFSSLSSTLTQNPIWERGGEDENPLSRVLLLTPLQLQISACLAVQ